MQQSVIPSDISRTRGEPDGVESVFRNMGRLAGWFMLIITVFEPLLPGTGTPLWANYPVNALYPQGSAGDLSGSSEKEGHCKTPLNPVPWPEGQTGIFPPFLEMGNGKYNRGSHLVEKGETLWRIAMQYGTSVETLQSLNRIPDPTMIRYGRLIRVPPSKVSRGAKSSLKEVKKEAFHLVENGENLWRIAMQYGTSVETLQKLNTIPDPTMIRYGRVIRVPPGKRSRGVKRSLASLKKEKKEALHLVQNGETLWRIAKQYGTSVETLQGLNRIDDPTMIRYGRLIRVPPEKGMGEAGISLSSLKRAKQGGYHLVEKGETLWRIAKRYKTSVETLLRINGIDDPTRVPYGNRIRIPRAKGGDETAQRRFHGMSFRKQIAFLKRWTIKEGHPYLAAIVETAHRFNIDSRLYASLIWEESWFDRHASSTAGCRGLAQLNPRVHPVSKDIRENFRRSARYFMKLYLYFIDEGFDRRAAVISALAAYNRGDTRVRSDIRAGRWDGKTIDKIPYFETRNYIVRVLERCRMNYHAVL